MRPRTVARAQRVVTLVPCEPVMKQDGLAPALDLLAAIRHGRMGDDSYLVAFSHKGEPASKARHRWRSGGGAYTPAKTIADEEEMAIHFRAAMRGRTLEGNIAVAVVFFRSTHHRIDLDNLMKLILDAGTRARAWLDDSQVTAQAAILELDHEDPRTIVALGPTESSLVRGKGKLTIVWARCGTEFKGSTSGRQRLYCSSACAHPKSMARCAICGKEFRRRSARQRYCSKKCAQSDPLVRQAVASSRPWPKCQVCGGRVSRREYLRCSTCCRKGRKIGSKNKPKAQARTTIRAKALGG